MDTKLFFKAIGDLIKGGFSFEDGNNNKIQLDVELDPTTINKFTKPNNSPISQLKQQNSLLLESGEDENVECEEEKNN